MTSHPAWGPIGKKVSPDDFPVGGFAKMVRERYDPLYGISGEELRTYKVEVEATKSVVERTTIEVQAYNIEQAKEIARAEAEEEFWDFDDVDILSVEEKDAPFSQQQEPEREVA